MKTKKEECKKVGNILEGLAEHIVSTGDAKKRIHGTVILDDGMEIKIVYWGESDMLLLDIEAEKEKYDAGGHTESFEEYMISKGAYAENVIEADDTVWEYCGMQDPDKEIRFCESTGYFTDSEIRQMRQRKQYHKMQYVTDLF